ncbi:MAG TPA: methyltransferase domain-containing protein [Streptosporangiaceae bacterium]|jgi:SAM-dependent methyltransferase
MSGKMVFDAEASRNLEAVYQTPDVVRQRQETLSALLPQPGERALDVGCGPGLLVEEIADRVGPAGQVTGIDIAHSMLDLARRRCARFGTRVTINEADATHLPFDDAEFDAGVSTQVYEYVSGVGSALAELHRVLKPGGRVVIIDTDWDSIVWNARDRTRMNRILAAWSERFADPHLPRTLARQLTDAGFDVQRRDVLVLFNPDYDANTYSLTNARILADFVTGRDGLTRQDIQEWEADLRHLGETGTYFFSLNRYLFAATKPAGRR